MNNFVFHEEYIIDIPEEKLPMFEDFIIQYGLYGKLPELDGFELVFWKTIQRRIDADKNFYEITCLKRRIAAINSRIEHGKSSDKDLENLTMYEQKLNELNEKSRVFSYDTKHTRNTNNHELNEKSRVKLTNSPYDTEFDIDSDIDIEFDTDTDIEHQKMPTKASPSQINYSKELFNLFKDAGLPCSKGNEISFLQTDFKNALNYLHKTSEYQHITSDDVIGAVRNYIEVLNDESSYVSTKMNFFSLVKSKMFYNLLPSNFDANNFKDWNAKTEKTETEEDSIQTDREYQECPSCHEVMMYYHRKKQRYICCSCLKYFDRNMKEVDG